MASHYEIRSSLKEIEAGKLVSSFEVQIPTGKNIAHYDTDNNEPKKTILRYHEFDDNSAEEDVPGKHIIDWDGVYHTVVIEINSDMAIPGGDVARKTDIAD